MQNMLILHLNSLHGYKAIHIYFPLVSIHIKKLSYSPRHSNVCYQCPVLLRSAGQPSVPDSVITDIQKVSLEELSSRILALVQFRAFS
jgi:hypothetical protein